MRLIADSGSTKTEWCLVDKMGVVARVTTLGMNPYVNTDESLHYIISNELLSSDIEASKVSSIEFYGAGCSDSIQINRITNVLSKSFSAKIEVDHDLLGAAKSVCGNKEGIAVILGTGSNSCHYDGTKILKNVRSLGYILGDEGSGCYIGKKLIQDYLNEDIPINVKSNLEQEFSLSPTTIFDHVYKQTLPNRYLASFALWVSSNSSDSYLKGIIKASFQDFFKQHIIKYENYQTLPINVVGSVGFHNKEILQEVTNSFGCTLGKVIKSPIEGLI